jgi:hypothetical protein
MTRTAEQIDPSAAAVPEWQALSAKQARVYEGTKGL